MNEVQKFISNNQHQFGYIMQEASRQWIKKDPIGALTVGDCNSVVEKHGQYHELVEKVRNLEDENEQLKAMLSATQNDMQIIRDNLNRTHSSMENAIQDYFERVKQIKP